MLSTTGGYTIKETNNGVALLKNDRVVSRYYIEQLKNTKWRVRLSGAQFGFEIEWFVPAENTTYGQLFNHCVKNLNSIIDELLTNY
jgi:hypothetical protein